MASESREPSAGAAVGTHERVAATTQHAPPRYGRIVRSSRVVTVPVPTGTVLVDANAGRRLTLDQFGSRIWTLLAEQPTLPALVERVRRDDRRSEQVAEDVAALLMRWLELRLIDWR